MTRATKKIDHVFLYEKYIISHISIELWRKGNRIVTEFLSKQFKNWHNL